MEQEPPVETERPSDPFNEEFDTEEVVGNPNTQERTSQAEEVAEPAQTDEEIPATSEKETNEQEMVVVVPEARTAEKAAGPKIMLYSQDEGRKIRRNQTTLRKFIAKTTKHFLSV